MIDVKYIGKKPSAIDNVASSGKTWAGNGDVQSVTASQARRLIAYRDQWELVNPDDLNEVNEPTITRVLDQTGKQVDVSEADLNRPLERLSATELVALAKQRFGKEFNPRIGKTRLINEIEELEKGTDPAGPFKSDLK